MNPESRIFCVAEHYFRITFTDTKYNTFAVQSSAAGGTRYFAQRANPFQAGIDLRLHF